MKVTRLVASASPSRTLATSRTSTGRPPCALTTALRTSDASRSQRPASSRSLRLPVTSESAGMRAFDIISAPRTMSGSSP